MGQKFLSALDRCPPWRGLNWKVPKFKVRLFYFEPTLTRTPPPPFLIMGMWELWESLSVYLTSKVRAVSYFLLREHSLPINKCLGKKHKWEKLFMCLLYGGRLWFRCSCGTWKKCPLCGVSALERFCYKGFLRNSSETKFFVRLREVSALEDVRFREVPL